MKNIIYGCLIVLLAISFGCEKDEIILDDNNTNSVIEASVKKGRLDLNLPGKGDLNIIGDVLTLYIDYNNAADFYIYSNTDLTNQTNSNGIENFMANYRAEMSANFTIYSVQVSSVINCGYVDKWTVNADEYFAHFPNTFGVTAFDTTTNAVRKKPRPTTDTAENGNDEATPSSDDIISLSGPSFPYDICF